MPKAGQVFLSTIWLPNDIPSLIDLQHAKIVIEQVNKGEDVVFALEPSEDLK